MLKSIYIYIYFFGGGENRLQCNKKQKTLHSRVVFFLSFNVVLNQFTRDEQEYRQISKVPLRLHLLHLCCVKLLPSAAFPFLQQTGHRM